VDTSGGGIRICYLLGSRIRTDMGNAKKTRTGEEESLATRQLIPTMAMDTGSITFLPLL
jgi:hypothetical protein